MLKYNLLGQTVTFEDAAERYYDLQFALNQAYAKASSRFSEWYKAQGNIQSVLNNYLPFTDSLIEELAFLPLFNQLAACGIYDISEQSYAQSCISSAQSEQSLDVIEEQYNAILRRQNAEKEYRADRKAGRGRWRGGGFGMSGAIKGAANAAVLNTVSGLGHSVFNAIGNAGSSLSASMDKSSLYKNSATQDTLLRGILLDLHTAYCAHINLLNTRKGNYVRSVFDENKSSALFENAKKVPEKRSELLLQAFVQCPWNAGLIKYLFVHYPNDRSAVCAAAQRFSINLSDKVEEILAQEYDAAAHTSESAALAAKARILDHMNKYGVTESPTLDKLETDCLRRLCTGYESASEAACTQLIEEVRSYQAQEKLKGPFFELLENRIAAIWTGELAEVCRGLDTADEASCQHRVEAIHQHKAPDKLKQPFLQKVQARIEHIWSAEDGEIFDNLYLKTDITDSRSVSEAISYIESKGRTASSKQYLSILNACTPENVERARLYQSTKRYKIYIALAILFLFATGLGEIYEDLYAIWVISIPFFVMAHRMKKAWKALTLSGKIVHPALLSQ